MAGTPGTRSPGGARLGRVLPLTLLAVVLAATVILRQRGKRHVPPPRAPATGQVRPAPVDPFTTIPRDTLPIAWRDWSSATFAEARARGVPVIALVDAAWGESCVLYAAALAADPETRAALETGVLPVRVDADRRPDVHDRFCIESSVLPEWIFLTPDGETWGLSDALPLAQLPPRIAELRAAPRFARPDPGLESLRRLQPVRPATPKLSAIPERVFSALQAEWPRAGVALGSDSPLLDGGALEFVREYAARRHSAAARALYLDGVRRLAAAVDSTGGLEQEIFPAPGRVMRGRFLATHATLLEHCLRANAMQADPICARAAERVAAWMESTLYDPRAGLFRAAQGTLVVQDGRPVLTAAELARVRASGHAHLPAPAVVPVCPIAANARAAAALLRFTGADASAVRHRARGAAVLERLQTFSMRAGHVPHDLAIGADGGLHASDVDLLADYAELGLALLRATAPRDTVHARALAETILARFAPKGGGAFFDVPPAGPQAPERMRMRLAPLPENARASLFLLEFARATGEARFDAAARRALEDWSSSVRAQSASPAALYGTAVLAALPAAHP